MTKPEIVCICGSTRFKDEWSYWRQRFTCNGKIVLAIEIVTSKDMVTTDPELKSRLDELHKRKIDLADRVFILNVEGFIGDSTRSEIEYADRFGKPIEYLEPQSPDEDSESQAPDPEAARVLGSAGALLPSQG